MQIKKAKVYPCDFRNKSVKVLTMECSSDITIIHIVNWGRRGRDCMVIGFNTTYAISAYHHRCWEFESRSGRGVQHYVIKFVTDL